MQVRSVLSPLAAAPPAAGVPAREAGDAYVGRQDAGAVKASDLAALFAPKEPALADCELWRAELPGGVYTSPAVGPQGELYAVSHRFGVTCRDANGGFRWQARIPDVSHQAAPLVTDQGVVVVTETGVTCLGKGGEPVWTSPVRTSQGGAVPGPDGSLYFMNDRGRVFRLDGRDGTEIWHSDMPPGPWNMNPARVSSDSEGRVYSVLHPGRMQVRDGDGQVVGGSGDGGCRVPSGVSVDSRGNAVWITQDCDLRCASADGTDRWTAWFSTGPAIPALLELTSKPVFSPDESTVYVGGQNGAFHAVDMATGDPRWSRNVGAQVDGDHVKVGRDGTIYVAGESPASLQALSPDDGRTLWSFRPKNGNTRVGVAMHGDTVYLTTSDGKVHALDREALAKRAVPVAVEKPLEIRLEAGTLTIGGVSLAVKG